MGIVVPRPAIRARESRAIHAALARAYERTAFRVIDLTDDSDHGLYDTLEQAHGCVAFDGLTEFQIWRGDVLLTSVERA